MTNPHKKMNVIDVQLNGQALPLHGVQTIQLGGYERKTELSDSGTFFRQSMRPFRLQMSLIMREGTKIIPYQDIDDATVVITTDTGQTYTVSNAWVETADGLDRNQGTFGLTISGNPAIEVA